MRELPLRHTSICPAGTVSFKKPWKGCPDPRGSHSGSLVGNSLIIFGGYGGPGFSRRDFNDIYVRFTKLCVVMLMQLHTHPDTNLGVSSIPSNQEGCREAMKKTPQNVSPQYGILTQQCQHT